MTNKTTRKLYGDTIEIDFYPDSHRYKLAGHKDYLISVTAITGLIDKSRFLIPWATKLASDDLIARLERGEKLNHEIVLAACNLHSAKKEEAATIGSMVHDYAERFARAKIEGTKLPEIPENAPEPVLNGIMAFLDWVKDHKVIFLQSERMVYSRSIGYVGITDLIAIIDGKRYICDYKTSKGLYDEYYLQLSAYWIAYEEETGERLDGGLLLHFDKETGAFTAKDLDRENHINNHSAFYGLYDAKKRLKEMAK